MKYLGTPPFRVRIEYRVWSDYHVTGEKLIIQSFKAACQISFILGYTSNQKIHEYVRDKLSSHDERFGFLTSSMIIVQY